MTTGLLTYEQVAAHFGVDVRTIRRWVARKKLSAVRMSHRTVRFRPADVEAAEKKLTQQAL